MDTDMQIQTQEPDLTLTDPALAARAAARLRKAAAAIRDTEPARAAALDRQAAVYAAQGPPAPSEQ